MQISEEFRAQARDDAKPTRRMTEAQKARLHELAQAREQEQASLAAFAQRISQYEPTLQNLAAIIRACCPLTKAGDLQRRAWKLKHWLLRGHKLGGCGKEGMPREINSPTEVSLFSELTASEQRMTAERFGREWPHDIKPALSTRMKGKRERPSRLAKRLVWSEQEKAGSQSL